MPNSSTETIEYNPKRGHWNEKMAVLAFLIAGILTVCGAEEKTATTESVRRVDGYKGIWFDLGQRSEFGPKYSVGLGTYTAKHCPLAVYAPAAQKTFFVYGGTTQADKRHLLAMVSCYDHRTKQVQKTIVIHDKKGGIFADLAQNT